MTSLSARRWRRKKKVRSVELKGLVKDLQTLVEELQLNVHQAKQLLELVNGEQPRYVEAGGVSIFSHAIALSCHQEGGDHYFVREVPAKGKSDMGKTLISLKDESGHSVSCVLRSIMTDMLYHSMISENGNKPLEQLLGELNRNMFDSKSLSDDEFFTSIDVEINHENLEMSYVSGGHPPFILIRGDDVRALPELKGAGHNPPLGMIKDAEFSAGKLKLKCGDKLIFYTDGLTEATAKGESGPITTGQFVEMVSQYRSCPFQRL